MLTVALLGIVSYHSFQDPLVVAEPQRLALTPAIDGRFESAEWDAFVSTPNKENFFQWEPGAIYAASRLAPGEDMIVSLDMKSNGWLIGADNLQYRVTITDDKPVVRVTRLDATQAAGPAWINQPYLAEGARVAAAKEGGEWFVELSATDPDEAAIPRGERTKIGVRIDPFESGRNIEPFEPRIMTPIELTLDRGSNIPGGLQWKPQLVTRTVSAGETFFVRLTFNGTNAMGLKQIAIQSKGAESEPSAQLEYPFPAFDKKGRAFVDFKTPIPADAKPGYRIVQSAVWDQSGSTAILKTSFRVGPLIELDLREPKNLKVSDKDRKLRIPYYVNSNSPRKVDGVVDISTPGGWLLETGDGKGFTVYHSRSGLRRVFDVNVPAGAQGRFPITLTAKVGDKTFVETSYIHID